jgi:hypothetical protein
MPRLIRSSTVVLVADLARALDYYYREATR